MRGLSLKDPTNALILRVCFLAYTGFIAVFGLYWIHVTVTPFENSCNTGIKQGTIHDALIIGGITTVALLISGYLAMRPPKSWGQLALAIWALGLVSLIGYTLVVGANLDWCAFANGSG